MSEFDCVRQQAEGQFFDRKTCYDYSGGKPKRLAVRDVARILAETLTTMANADGGTVVRPALRAQVREGLLEDKRILLFEVDWSPDMHRAGYARKAKRGDGGMSRPSEILTSRIGY